MRSSLHLSHILDRKKGAKLERKRIGVTFEYNGQTFPMKVAESQRIEAAWRRGLAHFGIRPEDAQNLGLFLDGNLLDRSQSFEAAGVKEGALLRIQPLVQRAGAWLWVDHC